MNTYGYIPNPRKEDSYKEQILATPKESVNHPEHYQGKGIEVIDIIEAFELNFSLGNSIKYILRADKKGNKKQDLEKAIWYLNNELNKFKG
jgi:hypothetical protein